MASPAMSAFSVLDKIAGRITFQHALQTAVSMKLHRFLRAECHMRVSNVCRGGIFGTCVTDLAPLRERMVVYPARVASPRIRQMKYSVGRCFAWCILYRASSRRGAA